MALQNNIFQNRVRPTLPAILQDERVFVYIPKATSGKAGIASFNDEDFNLLNSEASLKWSMRLQIENNYVNDPLQTMARVKLSDEEFVHVNEITKITHPITNKTYSNNKSSLKLKRTSQNLFDKPGLIMLNEDEFYSKTTNSTDDSDIGNYNIYRLKHNNPLEKASVVKLDNQDFHYNTSNEIVRINWPKAHDSSGSSNTDGYGLVKINQDGYLQFDNGLLDVNTNKLLNKLNVKPTYGADNESGFEDYNDYVENSYAKRDDNGNILLKLTKDAIGLSKVANKSFEEYVYNDFGTEMKNYFVTEFNEKLDKTTWNNLFNDWSEPNENTVQKVVNDLRLEDAAIYDAIRSNRLFLGFFENKQELENVYKAAQFTYGSTAYLISTKSYWKVRPNNVNIVIENRVPTNSDVPDVARQSTSFYRVGRRDTGEVYQWNGSSFDLTNETLKWVDVVLANEEDIVPYIQSHDSQFFFEGFRIGCLESDGVLKFVNSQWIPDGSMFYEWCDSYIETLAWNSFVENDPLVLKPNGIASTGSSGRWVSSDHVHPTDETRLAKSTFSTTNIEVNSQFTNNDNSDFNVQLNDGGNRVLNIPYVRKSKSLHNWNGQNLFVDSESNEDYYWSGTQLEFEAQKDDIKNQSIIFVDDYEEDSAEILVSEEQLEKHGITLSSGSNEELIIVMSNEAEYFQGEPVSIDIDVSPNGSNRYVLRPALPNNVLDNQLLTVENNKLKTITNSVSTKVVLIDENGQVKTRDDDDYVLRATSLTPNQLLVGTADGRKINSLQISNIENGIIVADGFGAIKSTAFGSAGKLLQTDGINGDKLVATMNVNTLVTTNKNEFTNSGMVISDGTGLVKCVSLGEQEDQIIVTNGINGIKKLTIPNESLLFVNNVGKVSAFPSSITDEGKVITVQANGHFGLQTPAAFPTNLPITTKKNNSTIGMTLSFGEPQTFEEGVLYLW